MALKYHRNNKTQDIDRSTVNGEISTAATPQTSIHRGDYKTKQAVLTVQFVYVCAKDV